MFLSPPGLHFSLRTLLVVAPMIIRSDTPNSHQFKKKPNQHRAAKNDASAGSAGSSSCACLLFDPRGSCPWGIVTTVALRPSGQRNMSDPAQKSLPGLWVGPAQWCLGSPPLRGVRQQCQPLQLLSWNSSLS